MKTFLLSVTVSLTLVAGAAGQSVGQTAPDFAYPALGGGEIRLADHQGKVVFVFLFGNTCPFCLAVGNRTETEINAVHRSNPSFQAIGLDLWDSSSSAASVTAFRNQTGVTYPLGLRAGSMSQLYAITYDRVMVIGADGILRYKGATATSSTLSAARAVIDDLLAGISLDTEDLPRPNFTLSTGFPNPFSLQTEIGFSTESAGTVRLAVYDLLGRQVALLADGFRAAGRHTEVWQPDPGTPPGIYSYALETPEGRLTKSVILNR